MNFATALFTLTSVTNTVDVRDLAQLSSGAVLAATSGGIDRFEVDPKSQSKLRWVRTLHVEDGLPSHEVWAVREVGGVVYAATSGGLARVEDSAAHRLGDGRPWMGLPSANDGEDALAYAERLLALEARLPKGELVTALAERDGWTVRVGADGWLVVERGARTLFSAHIAGRPLAIAFDAHGAWVGSTEAVMRLEGVGCADRRAQEPAISFRAVPVVCNGSCAAESAPVPPLAVRAQGTELVAIDARGGQWRFNAEGARFGGVLHAPKVSAFLGNGRVHARHGEGVHEADRRLTPKDQICSNHVTSMTKHQGRWVAGTFDAGACWSKDGEHWRTFSRPSIPSEVVYDVASSGRYLWVATANGLGRYDGRRFTQYAFGGRNPFGLRSLSVLAVLPGESRVGLVEQRGVSWVAPKGGLQVRDESHREWTNHVTVAAAAGPYLWLGTEDRGLLRFDGSAWRTYHDARDLPDNWVTAVDGDASGRAVVGTCQHGAVLFEPERTLVFRASDGLADDMVTAVHLGDGPGDAVIGTLSGVSFVERGHLAFRLGPKEGLADPRVASISRFDDELWIGTEAGLSRFRPREPQASMVAKAR